MADYLGWTATAVFVASYCFTRAQAIKQVQMIGALMWACYGLLIGAFPVVAANLLVFGAAALTLGGRPESESARSYRRPPTSSRCTSRSAGSSYTR